MNRVKSPYFKAQYHILKNTNNKQYSGFAFLQDSRAVSECGFFAVRELQSPRALWGCHGFGDLLCRHWKQGEGHKEPSVAKTVPAPSRDRHIVADITHADGFLTHVHYQPAGVQHYFKFFNFSGYRVSFPACTE